MKNIGIIGGGIIGLCSAYYLSKSGYKVTIIDSGDFTEGCSFGNAGMIVPSHFIPLAAPGMIAKGIRWMFDSKSPFYIKPKLAADLMTWGYHFYKSSTKEHVDRAIPALTEISLFSKDLYKQLASELPFDFGFKESGLLMLYQTATAEKEESETAHLAHAHGMEARILSAEEVQQLEPEVVVKVRGGIYFPGDAHLTPQQLVRQLVLYLKGKEVKFEPRAEVTEFTVQESELKAVKTERGDFYFDQVVIAGGAWSGLLCSKLGISLLMQAGKGYSFTLDVKKNVKIPSIFCEARVAVTPMGNTLRFGGTMEITGIDHRINMNRVKGIVDAARRYYPEMGVNLPPTQDVWHGLRPCSPDGLPYIGRLEKVKNVIMATGHSMMGLSLGPATGKLVSEIIAEEKSSLGIRPFDPTRFN